MKEPSKKVSIHASAREATDPASAPPLPADLFQSTPPHGRRRSIGSGEPGKGRVSIHASAREATGAVIPGVMLTGVFQSTPPHGRRRGCHPPWPGMTRFNPRLRTGGDYPCRPPMLHRVGFNPRLRTGGDKCAWDIWGESYEFQSTPPHGRRRARLELAALRWKLFQSTPPHGRRRLAWPAAIASETVSIHASAREATVTGVGLRG